MVRLNLSSDDVKIVKIQLSSLKNAKKYINVRKKQSSIWRINKDFYLNNPKSLTTLKKSLNNRTSKNRKII